MGGQRVTYELLIEATLTESGDYYGTDETLQWFLDRAERDAQNMQVYVAKGATDPKRVRASIKVARVILEPDTSGER